VEDAVRRLEEAARRHPESLEARRALRTATRELQRRRKPPEPPSDDFPELDATYQAAPTRRNPDTALGATVGGVVPPTVLVAAGPAPFSTPVSMPLPALPTTRAPGPSGRSLLVVAGAAILVALAAGVLLISRGGPPSAAAAARLRVRSQPPGARVFLDGRDTGVVTDGELSVPVASAGTVVLAFHKPDFREASRELRQPVASGEVRVALEELPPASVFIPVVTDPPGASVTLDGEALAGVTPLQVSLDPAREHRLALRLDGRGTQEVQIAAGAPPAEVRLALDPSGPAGTVAVTASYPLDVLWRGRVLGHGQPPPRVSVPAGRQALTLVSPTYFLRQTMTVDVRPPAVAEVAAPALGKINIRANPDNCQIFIDGTFVEYPPILDRAIAVGEHKVGFKWPDGSHREETVEVPRGVPTYVTGRKE